MIAIDIPTAATAPLRDRVLALLQKSRRRTSLRLIADSVDAGTDETEAALEQLEIDGEITENEIGWGVYRVSRARTPTPEYQAQLAVDSTRIFKVIDHAKDPLSNRAIGQALGLSDQYVAMVCRELSADGRVHKSAYNRQSCWVSSRVVPMKRRLVNYMIREEGDRYERCVRLSECLGAAMRERPEWLVARCPAECTSRSERPAGSELAEIAGRRREASNG